MPKTRPEPVCRWSKCSIQSHPGPVAIVLYYLYLSTLSMLSRVSAAHRVQCNWVHLAVFHVISSGSSLHFILIHCNTAILQALASLLTIPYILLFVTVSDMLKNMQSRKYSFKLLPKCLIRSGRSSHHEQWRSCGKNVWNSVHKITKKRSKPVCGWPLCSFFVPTCLQAKYLASKIASDHTKVINTDEVHSVVCWGTVAVQCSACSVWH